MTGLPVVHVRQGALRIERPPVVIRAIVSTGVAITVRMRRPCAGGLLHAALDPVDGTMAPRLADLLRDLRLEGPLEGSAATVVGGADVLKLRTRRGAGAALPPWALDTVVSLRAAGIRVTKVEVLAEGGRIVELDVASGEATARPIAARMPRTAVASVASVAVPAVASAAADGPTRAPAPGAVVPVNMGCMEVAQAPARLTAILGSCVGIALLETRRGVGALAHVMMPRHTGNGEARAKYADTAVPLLLSAIESAGGDPRHVKAYLAGGANVLGGEGSPLTDIPRRNVEEARAALLRAAIVGHEEDVGGRTGRKMFVDLGSGAMTVRFLRGGGGS